MCIIPKKDNKMFCPGNKCSHYNKATKYPTKCYYEPQCWRGSLDISLLMIKKIIQRTVKVLRRDNNKYSK